MGDPCSACMPRALSSLLVITAHSGRSPTELFQSEQAETTRLKTQVSDLEGALHQARRDTEDVRQIEQESRAREVQALAAAKNIQEQAVVQRAYADELALENDRLAREGADLARMIADKELSEQRLNEHIRNLDANNVKMQKVMV
jgi:hypothetical protein